MRVFPGCGGGGNLALTVGRDRSTFALNHIMARFDTGETYDSGIRYDAPDGEPLVYGYMKDLSKLFEVPFDDPGISFNELTAFGTDNVQRMNTNDPVGLATRIAATTAALNVVLNCATDDTVKLGARKAAKEVKKTFRANLPEAISAIWLIVAGHYGMNAPQLLEVFPRGRSVFNAGGATDDGLQVELDALVVALTAKQAALGAAVVATATTLKTNWMAIHETSEEASSAKSNTEEGKREARRNLQLELYFNLIELMKMFPRQPDKLALYMTQSLLEDHPPTPPTPPPGP